jgi:CheY-like chemotaxis protein
MVMTLASEKRILVVDDEPDVRNFLATCIEDAGFNVETASDGAEALEKVKNESPDLVTLDMVMPRVSGINFMRRLRAMGDFNHLPVIVITAHAHDDLGSEDLKEFNAFASGLRPRYTMEKPVTPEKLVRAISEILGVDIIVSTDLEDDVERSELMKKVSAADEDTLKRIQALLSKQKD